MYNRPVIHWSILTPAEEYMHSLRNYINEILERIIRSKLSTTERETQSGTSYNKTESSLGRNIATSNVHAQSIPHTLGHLLRTHEISRSYSVTCCTATPLLHSGRITTFSHRPPVSSVLPSTSFLLGLGLFTFLAVFSSLSRIHPRTVTADKAASFACTASATEVHTFIGQYTNHHIYPFP